MVKRDVLDRYEQAASGGYIIDVAAINVEALYDDFDRSAPYVRRDLDQDLVDERLCSAAVFGFVRAVHRCLQLGFADTITLWHPPLPRHSPNGQSPTHPDGS